MIYILRKNINCKILVKDISFFLNSNEKLSSKKKIYTDSFNALSTSKGIDFLAIIFIFLLIAAFFFNSILLQFLSVWFSIYFPRIFLRFTILYQYKPFCISDYNKFETRFNNLSNSNPLNIYLVFSLTIISLIIYIWLDTQLKSWDFY